ncbi:DUF3784 domain-containing protein [Vagococcus fluvialis]|uniref:DUF3784 domain-containing protein n=1 Tax=Vagococcus fluvialis TaxID=2738 RepID=UPI003B58FA9C
MLDIVIFSFAVLIVLAVIVGCFILGYQLSKGKWLMLIAGYNDLSEKVRAQLDDKKVGKDASKVCYLTGFFLIVEALLVYLISNITYLQQTDRSLLVILFPLVIYMYVVFKQVKQSSAYYNQFKNY